MKAVLSSLFLLFCFAVSFASIDLDGEIAKLRATADSLHGIGRTDSAAIVGERAILLAVESGNPALIVGAHSSQGVFLRSLGRIEEALENYDAALAIVTSGKFRENPTQEAIEEIASLYINLAVLNLDTQHKEQASENAVLSADWISKSDDLQLRSTVYGVVGSVMTGCGDLDKALRYQGLAYTDAIASGDKEAAFRAAAYTMLIADRLGDKAEAGQWREKCTALVPEIESAMARLVYYQAECSICLANGDSKGAVLWFNKILTTDGIDNLPFVKFDCYNNLHSAYADMGDYKSAYSTMVASTELRDSLWEHEKAESLRDLTVKYQTKETELALAQSETKRATILVWMFAIVGMLLLAVIVFVVYANRQRRRRMQREMEFTRLRADTDQQLTQQYIEGLENERRRMSRELHDGVCNDLLAIQMNINNGKPLESTVRLIDTCREAVRRISHELMPPEFAYANLDEVVRLFVVKQAEANAGNIALAYESSVTDAEWTVVPDDVSLDVYRIIQESVGNSIKHSGATEIKVILILNGNLLEAAIADNGTYKDSGRKGLGLESIRKRASSIKGTVEFDSAGNAGTTVRLSVRV